MPKNHWERTKVIGNIDFAMRNTKKPLEIPQKLGMLKIDGNGTYSCENADVSLETPKS